MSVLGTLRSNWRLVALVLILVVSLSAIFAPDFRDTEGPTNLQYGIELEGGTRLRAPIAGLTAEDVAVPSDRSSFEQRVAASLDIDRTDVVVRGNRANATVEVLAEGVDRDAFVDALRGAGATVDPAGVRAGVTAETREDMVSAINDKISAAGLSGATARLANTPTGEYFVVIEAPGRDAEELREFLSERGSVQVVAYYPDPDSDSNEGVYVNRTVLERGSGADRGDFDDIGIPQFSEEDGWILQVTVNESVAPRFAETMVETGFGLGGPRPGARCTFNGSYGSMDPSSGNRCLLVVSDGEVVSSFGVRPGLAEAFETGEFATNPVIVFDVRTAADARELMVHLRAGRLPAPLNFDAGTTDEVAPPLAEQFKQNSLLTGVIAVFAVAGVVFLRYRDPKVAAPMVVTALSEVAILLGFAAAVGLALDLSHIAGFIAVIGTGVDDLIIIADEVMAEGEVASGRVFRTRFRKAFWIIGAAAATTIIAMSPLASPFLGLGDLQGFAIVTIVGVLVGVLITRPAYGDILRSLLTDR